jgi:hypothetical protein
MRARAPRGLRVAATVCRRGVVALLSAVVIATAAGPAAAAT